MGMFNSEIKNRVTANYKLEEIFEHSEYETI